MRLSPAIRQEIATSFRSAGDCHTVRRRAEEYANLYGVTLQAVYKAAKSQGWESGRAPRADRGTRIKNVPDSTIEAAAQILHATHTEKGRIPASAQGVIEVMEQSGLLKPGEIKAHWLNAQLRTRNLSKRAALAPTPRSLQMSTHPNHVHSVDASQCAQWFIKPSGAVAHQRRNFQVYSNKDGSPNRITRFLCVDHYSGAFTVWYADRPESTATFLEFLLFHAWAPKDQVAARLSEHLFANGTGVLPVSEAITNFARSFPLRGLPDILYSDAGSGLTSGTSRDLMAALSVRQIEHLPGNPASKGSVETMQRHWEEAFEFGLKLRPAASMDELNARALAYCARYNAERIHTRHGRTRFACWAEDLAACGAPLRDLPDPELVRSLALTPSQKREVAPNGLIRFRPKGPKAAESHSGVYRIPDTSVWGGEVEVRYSVFDYPKILATCRATGETFELAPIQRNAAGFYPEISGIIGESFHAAAHTPAEKALAAINAASPTPADTERRKLARPRSTAHVPGVPANLVVHPQISADQSGAGTAPVYPEIARAPIQITDTDRAPAPLSGVDLKERLLSSLGCTYPELTAAQQRAFRDAAAGAVHPNELSRIANTIRDLAPHQGPILAYGGQS